MSLVTSVKMALNFPVNCTIVQVHALVLYFLQDYEYYLLALSSSLTNPIPLYQHLSSTQQWPRLCRQVCLHRT
jgi:hypothetical protein